MTTTKYSRFPRLTKAKMNLKFLNESLNLKNFGVDFSDDLVSGGWVLPDGTILDFRRHEKNNQTLKHSRIYSAFSFPDERPFSAFR